MGYWEERGSVAFHNCLIMYAGDSAISVSIRCELKPIIYSVGYLTLEDHGLNGDGSAVTQYGGAFTVAQECLIDSRQFYEADTVGLCCKKRMSRTNVHPATISVAAVLALSAGIERTGALSFLARRLLAPRPTWWRTNTRAARDCRVFRCLNSARWACR